MIGCDRATTVVTLWGREALVGLLLHISTLKHMTSKAANEAAARIRAAGDQDTKTQHQVIIRLLLVMSNLQHP